VWSAGQQTRGCPVGAVGPRGTKLWEDLRHVLIHGPRGTTAPRRDALGFWDLPLGQLGGEAPCVFRGGSVVGAGQSLFARRADRGSIRPYHIGMIDGRWPPAATRAWTAVGWNNEFGESGPRAARSFRKVVPTPPSALSPDSGPGGRTGRSSTGTKTRARRSFGGLRLSEARSSKRRAQIRRAGDPAGPSGLSTTATVRGRCCKKRLGGQEGEKKRPAVGPAWAGTTSKKQGPPPRGSRARCLRATRTSSSPVRLQASRARRSVTPTSAGFVVAPAASR